MPPEPPSLLCACSTCLHLCPPTHPASFSVCSPCHFMFSFNNMYVFKTRNYSSIFSMHCPGDPYTAYMHAVWLARSGSISTKATCRTAHQSSFTRENYKPFRQPKSFECIHIYTTGHAEHTDQCSHVGSPCSVGL